MNARPLTMCLLTAALCAIPAPAREGAKPARTLRGSGDIGSLGAGGESPRGDFYVRELIKRFDRDGDGKLDAAELAEALKARVAAGPGGQMRVHMLKMFDKNGDGRLDDEERAAAEKSRAGQIRRFDKNGDGQLDPEERAEARKAFLADHPEQVSPGN